MNKRQKKKLEKKKFKMFSNLSYRDARAISRLLHEWKVERKRGLKRVARCIRCRNAWLCEEGYDKTMCEIENCEDFKE